MCPECISTVTILTAGVSSAGGVGALVLSKLRRNKHANTKLPLEAINDIAEPESASFEEWVAAVATFGEETEQ